MYILDCLNGSFYLNLKREYKSKMFFNRRNLSIKNVVTVFFNRGTTFKNIDKLYEHPERTTKKIGLRIRQDL